MSGLYRLRQRGAYPPVLLGTELAAVDGPRAAMDGNCDRIVWIHGRIFSQSGGRPDGAKEIQGRARDPEGQRYPERKPGE